MNEHVSIWCTFSLIMGNLIIIQVGSKKPTGGGDDADNDLDELNAAGEEGAEGTQGGGGGGKNALAHAKSKVRKQ